MEENQKKLLIKSVLLGTIAGSVVIAVKTKPNRCSLTSCYKKTTDFLNFINENRGEIIEQLKSTSKKLTKAIDETTDDLKAISQNIKHLKESSSQVISTVQETKSSLITMYGTCKEKFEGTSSQQLEIDKDEDA